jgi:hypothetical protein
VGASTFHNPKVLRGLHRNSFTFFYIVIGSRIIIISSPLGGTPTNVVRKLLYFEEHTYGIPQRKRLSAALFIIRENNEIF